MFDYLTIGVVTRDLTDDGWKIGGAVAYAGITAHALNCQTAILTSAKPTFPFESLLPGITVQNLPATHTTTFSNDYTPTGRKQTIHALANPITIADLPANWQNSAIVHIAPLVQEVDPDLVSQFPNSLVAITPQGYMRHWDANGQVTPCHWEKADQILPLADAVILSEEDFGDEQMLSQYQAKSTLLVVTKGEQGCTIFWQGERRDFSAPTVTPQSLTGAGDIFAAAFLVHLWRNSGNAWDAAQFANQTAAKSVTANNLMDKYRVIQTMANLIQ